MVSGVRQPYWWRAPLRASLAAAPAAPQAAGVGEREAIAREVHKGRFLSEREATPFDQESKEAQAYCYRITDRILNALRAPSREPEGGAVLEDALDAWIVEGIKKADQRIAEIDPVGCSGMTPEDVKSGRVAAYQKGFQNGVKSTLTDASFVIMNAALATREEAPAEAGERQDAVVRVSAVAAGAQVDQVYGGEWCADPATAFRADLVKVLAPPRPAASPRGRAAGGMAAAHTKHSSLFVRPKISVVEMGGLR